MSDIETRITKYNFSSVVIYFLQTACLRQSERWDLSFHGVKQFFSDFTKNTEQWTLKSKKKLEL